MSEVDRELAARRRRMLRTRKKVQGTAERPRLSVFRSLKHISAQLIDDSRGHTITSASTFMPDVQGRTQGIDKKAAAKEVGKIVAEKARQAGIERVLFDRGPYLYRGRVKCLAEGAREAGLKF